MAASPPVTPQVPQTADTTTAAHRRARKRTRRACDKCNTSRTRCDGDHPWYEYGYNCNYNRQAKKRGRVPLKAKKDASNSTPSDGSADEDHDHRNESHTENELVNPASAAPVAQHTPAPLAQAAPSARLTYASPRVEDPQAFPVDNHSNSGSRHRSDLSGGFPQRMENCRLHGSSNGSFHGSPSAATPFFMATPSLSFGLPPRRDFERPSSHGGGGQVGELRYRCLEPLLPYMGNNFPVSVACDLFDVYLLDPGASLFRFSSPFILTRIFRKKSLLGPNPRPTSAALLATILWCCAQTADISVLLVPGARSRLTNALYELATYLISRRDPDRWRRIHGGLQIEYDREQADIFPETTGEPAGTIDDVLTFILLCIGVSAGDFKSDCLKWWSKAKRLALALRLDRQDAPGDYAHTAAFSVADVEQQEERRRVFWLLYAIDRHLALSYNRGIHIPDAICDVFAPLPDRVWEDFEDMNALPPRTIGPPVTITGTGFFEYFLPLMVILGDIIEVHHGQFHPRLGSLDKKYAEGAIAELIAGCEASLDRLARRAGINGVSQTPMRISNILAGPQDMTPLAEVPPPLPPPPRQTQYEQTRNSDQLDVKLVIAYCTFLLHVLHVLFYGKWDAISMLDNEDDWITSPRFVECASHAIEASDAVADILKLDPELNFMPYLFGIYLLHGSFILLLFADRMPQLGQNQSVEHACETIIRAHEVCVVTLSTEFQRNFRRVLRSTLYNVRGSTHESREEHRLARRQVLSLYRWTRGAKGLGI
ncbi:transcriptional activator xlnR [Emericellopsis atlantica]|uniref:Transcriptional activator xlnR n=1 Tax=Emericellopsis atlantica TaxID=2614577 RepID=A0A9P8CP16_9HYPO|nr:transcriptional activator xlnR [Emericellopsis atlantica]KAG9254083.1 transcriptional activator xlnR [Emericellopsis atlantica]